MAPSPEISILALLPPDVAARLDGEPELQEYVGSAVTDFAEAGATTGPAGWDVEELVKTLSPFLVEVGMSEEDVATVCSEFVEKCREALGGAGSGGAATRSSNGHAVVIAEPPPLAPPPAAADKMPPPFTSVSGSASRICGEASMPVQETAAPTSKKKARGTAPRAESGSGVSGDAATVANPSAAAGREKPTIVGLTQQSRFHAESITTDNKDNLLESLAKHLESLLGADGERREAEREDAEQSGDREKAAGKELVEAEKEEEERRSELARVEAGGDADKATDEAKAYNLISSVWERLREVSSRVLVQSHNGHFLNLIAVEIIFSKDKQLRYYEGNYDEFMNQREEELAKKVKQQENLD
ncbi:hypothetical protein M427DRAFT_29062 [Gonapodya prolifera JEL478]|uniref:Uncharacterized protein n=1 Tax=Gonapodya prolifera (strain JEL478) TaxID=1344416 RepID=A0A139ASH2_GONPJ|nr:hypothetical protein M427DRAFT_29062 [Gonapodya prolifera JEL478]|eukprot:KXS19649.1 hypothetical protein M427DRAFT_29062 [Gonapodya prolifera JEL478]